MRLVSLIINRSKNADDILVPSAFLRRYCNGEKFSLLGSDSLITKFLPKPAICA